MNNTLARFLITLFSVSWLVPAWLAISQVLGYAKSELWPFYANREYLLLLLVWCGAIQAFWVWRLCPLLGDQRKSVPPAGSSRGEPALPPGPEGPKT